MLFQLVYISYRNSHCNNKEIENILESSRRNNYNKNITGVLLYSDKKFLQVLEGERKQVNELYDFIKTDSRHRNAVLISLSPIMERTFPSWQMGAKKLDDKTYKLIHSYKEQFAGGYELVSLLEEEEIDEFQRLLNEKDTQVNVIRLITKLFD